MATYTTTIHDDGHIRTVAWLNSTKYVNYDCLDAFGQQDLDILVAANGGTLPLTNFDLVNTTLCKNGQSWFDTYHAFIVEYSPINQVDQTVKLVTDISGAITNILVDGQEIGAPVMSKIDPITGGIEISTPSGPFPLAKLMLADDLGLDRVVSGLALPAAGGFAQTVTQGIAVIAGYRIGSVGSPINLSASSNNYVDISASGAITISPVAVGAAAPNLAANCIRLGYVTTSVSAITTTVVTGKDSLGNPLRNTSAQPGCTLYGASTQAIAGATDTYIPFGSAALELYDNARMHSAGTNPTRITINKSGFYMVSAGITWGAGGGTVYFTVRKNGGAPSGLYQETISNGGKLSAAVAGLVYLQAGEYLEARVNAGNSITLTTAHFAAVRIG